METKNKKANKNAFVTDKNFINTNILFSLLCCVSFYHHFWSHFTDWYSNHAVMECLLSLCFLLCIQCITLWIWCIFMYICNISESLCTAGAHTSLTHLTCVCVCIQNRGIVCPLYVYNPVKMEMSSSADVLVLTDFCRLQPGNGLSLDWIRAIFFQISHLLPDWNIVDLMCSCRNQPGKVIRDKESKSNNKAVGWAGDGETCRIWLL